MIPAHWNLAHPEIRPAREIEELNVETEPVRFRPLEDRPEDLEAKGFESTLRVPKRKSGRGSNDEIENTAALFAPPWLTMTDQPAVESA